MHRGVLALVLLGACAPDVYQAVASAAGSGGSSGSTSSAGSGGSIGDGGLGGHAGSGDAPWAGCGDPPAAPSLCRSGCSIAPGGACACDGASAPNCPAGYWKICCAGHGAPCAAPDLAPGVDILPACGPGPAPAWCVTAEYPCSL